MVNKASVRHKRLNGDDVSMTANRLFTGLSPEFGDGLDNSRQTRCRCGRNLSRSTAKQSHDFTVGEHVSGHGIRHGVSVMRSRMDLRNVERIEPKYIDAFPTEDTAAYRWPHLRNCCRSLFFLGSAQPVSPHFLSHERLAECCTKSNA